MEDVAPTPAAATRREASNVAVTQDTTVMDSTAPVSYSLTEAWLMLMPKHIYKAPENLNATENQ